MDIGVRDCPSNDKAGFSTKPEWFGFSYQLDCPVLHATYGKVGLP
jgi:hypothetical protein